MGWLLFFMAILLIAVWLGSRKPKGYEEMKAILERFGVAPKKLEIIALLGYIRPGDAMVSAFRSFDALIVLRPSELVLIGHKKPGSIRTLDYDDIKEVSSDGRGLVIVMPTGDVKLRMEPESMRAFKDMLREARKGGSMKL